MDFAYTTVPANLGKFLDHIQKVGIPKKVTQKYLEAQGFKSTNDRSIIRVLKAIDFLSDSGEPTEVWKSYRNRENAKRVMADALRVAYSTLFENYPDAHRKDNEALRNFFTAHTDVGDDALNLIVRTFRTLSDLGDFETPGDPKVPAKPLAKVDKPVDGASARVGEQTSSGMVVNINIQLTLPETDDPKIYERLFEAMKKHLFP